jgi:hypothetical protein
VQEYLGVQRGHRRLSPEQVAELQAGVDHKWALLQARAKLECEPSLG